MTDASTTNPERDNGGAGRSRPHRDLFGWEGRALLPDVGSDEGNTGWGEDSTSSDASDIRRFLDDKPPHHI